MKDIRICDLMQLESFNFGLWFGKYEIPKFPAYSILLNVLKEPEMGFVKWVRVPSIIVSLRNKEVSKPLDQDPAVES
jgi:hypothetical protein